MRSRKVPLAVASAILLVVAFAGPAAATRGQPDLTVSFQMHLVSPADEPLDYALGFPFVGDTFGGRCTTPAMWIATINSTGTASHLGRVAVTQSHCTQINVLLPPPWDATFADGQMTVTGANGDELWIEYSGGFHFVPSGEQVGVSELHYTSMTIVGGTGMFTGATGALSGEAIDYWPDGPNIADFSGTISYDASQVANR